MSPRPPHADPSRTTVPRESPLEWLFARGADFDVSDEVGEVYRHVPEYERDLRKEELFAVLEEARMGQLSKRDLLQPIRLDPLMWELRFSFTAGVYRLYFGEPAEYPGVLVATRFHLKQTEGTDLEVTAAQDAEMALAAERFNGGIATRWGWPE